MGGFSFDVGLQRMQCKRLQGKTLGPKIRTSEDPTMALLERLAQVVDPMLLPREVEELGVATGVKMTTEKDDNVNNIEVEETNNIEDSRHVDANMQKCLLSILNKCFH